MQLLSATWYTAKLAPKGVRYRIRGMTYGEFIENQAMLAAHREASKAASEAVRNRLPKDVVDHSLRCCLLDWEGWEGENGKPLKFSADLVTQIGYGHAMELCHEIALRSQLGAALEKNSSSQSKPRPGPGTSTARTAAGAATATKKTRRRGRTTSA